MLQETNGSRTLPVTAITRHVMLGVVIGICAALWKISAYLKRLYKTSEIPEGGLSGMKSESSRHFDIAAIRFG